MICNWIVNIELPAIPERLAFSTDKTAGSVDIADLTSDGVESVVQAWGNEFRAHWLKRREDLGIIPKRERTE